ncbi:NucA/NucB deoxyribonuclease domain-containing protein [Kitasatospora sp. P5_F3]
MAGCGSSWDESQGSCDEYPFASTMQGGVGSQTMGAPFPEQIIQRDDLNRFYRKHGFYKIKGPSTSTRFLVDVINIPFIIQ